MTNCKIKNKIIFSWSNYVLINTLKKMDKSVEKNSKNLIKAEKPIRLL